MLALLSEPDGSRAIIRLRNTLEDLYFRMDTEFEIALESAHTWLNRAMFIGVAERLPSAAIVRFHEIL